MFISSGQRNTFSVYEHFVDEAKKHSIAIEALNAQPEHVHLLVNLSRSQTFEEVAK